ncbi:hypothetical protein BpHYR1_004356 [Brachionus plicatilis]|uniref:Uncharacterized protein n=1 Tax=Brachionus plicatilis TaxID=10195 RepID=A0A3M7PTV2_BRAPC|nr:hypothetical protein BpHYR1_004356 [Brachionus plicatilis]
MDRGPIFKIDHVVLDNTTKIIENPNKLIDEGKNINLSHSINQEDTLYHQVKILIVLLQLGILAFNN